MNSLRDTVAVICPSVLRCVCNLYQNYIVWQAPKRGTGGCKDNLLNAGVPFGSDDNPGTLREPVGEVPQLDPGKEDELGADSFNDFGEKGCGFRHGASDVDVGLFRRSAEREVRFNYLCANAAGISRQKRIKHFAQTPVFPPIAIENVVFIVFVVAGRGRGDCAVLIGSPVRVHHCRRTARVDSQRQDSRRTHLAVKDLVQRTIGELRRELKALLEIAHECSVGCFHCAG